MAGDHRVGRVPGGLEVSTGIKMTIKFNTFVMDTFCGHICPRSSGQCLPCGASCQSEVWGILT